MSRRRSSRRNQGPVAVRADVLRLVNRLKRNELVAVGSHGSWPRGRKVSTTYSSIPRNRSLHEYKLIVDAICNSSRVAILMLRGTLLQDNDQKRTLFNYLMSKLHVSRICCLNIGEFQNVDGATLEEALKKSFVGNIYFRDPRNETQRQEKRRIKAIIKKNKKKWGYREKLSRNDTWIILKKGCQSWFGPTELGREKALQYAGESKQKRSRFVERCRVNCRSQRCLGVSKKHRKRCCLCTRHESGYCRWHRL